MSAPRQRKFKGNGQFRWVAKMPKREGKDFDAESLEEFKKDWLPPPDENTISNKDYYFNSYAHSGIHEDMLKDQARTGSYQRAILNNKHLFEGRTVLDVGSGTGILCLFAAKAGAKRCIGIECSDVIHLARDIANDNGYGDVITYVHGRVEEVEIPVEKVDIILSEWMGYFLIYEAMLDSVILARDKWLVPNGLIFPDHARLYLAAIEDGDYKEDKIGFWNHLHGFDYSPMKPMVMQEPVSDTVCETVIASTVSCIRDIDLYTVKSEDVNFSTHFELKATRKDHFHALVAWFDVVFEACTPQIVLSTEPGKGYTHWKQTVMYLNEVIPAFPGEILDGTVSLRKSLQNPRDLDIRLEYKFNGKFPQDTTVQYFRLR